MRDAARLHIGDTGLLDCVLKSMNNVIVGNYTVRRAVNPSNRVLEYTIQELCNGLSVTEPEPKMVPERILTPTRVPGADNWTVRCECGARDDDGERMVAKMCCGC